MREIKWIWGGRHSDRDRKSETVHFLSINLDLDNGFVP